MDADNDIQLDELYQDIILDHHRSPRNYGSLPDPDLKAEGFNPFCGDRVGLSVSLDESGRIGAVGFSGEGCAISQASASMMSELLKGRTVDEAESLTAVFKGIMHGRDMTEEEEKRLGELAALEGVKKFPIRIKCALLGWSALQDAIDHYRQGQGTALHP